MMVIGCGSLGELDEGIDAWELRLGKGDVAVVVE